MTMNTLEWSKNNTGNVVATVRSPNERDMAAVLLDPAAEILTIAHLADLKVKIEHPVTTINDPGDLAQPGGIQTEPDEIVEGEVDLSVPVEGEPQVDE